MDNGDWTYFGPECPSGFDNCAIITSDFRFITLDAYDDTNESFYDTPDIDVSCLLGGAFFTFNGGGPWIALGETGFSLAIGDGERNWFITDRGSDDLESIWFDDDDEQSIIELIQIAERQGDTIRIGAVSEYDSVVVAWFDVTGFTVNYQRLPCS